MDLMNRLTLMQKQDRHEGINRIIYRDELGELRIRVEKRLQCVGFCAYNSISGILEKPERKILKIRVGPSHPLYPYPLVSLLFLDHQ